MVTPVVYHQGLTLNEVERRYEEVKEEFETIKKNYSGFFGRFKRKIDEFRDKKSLSDCCVVLIHLCLENSVKSDYSLNVEIARLNFEILTYLSTFDNSGIRRYKFN